MGEVPTHLLPARLVAEQESLAGPEDVVIAAAAASGDRPGHRQSPTWTSGDANGSAGSSTSTIMPPELHG